MDHKGKSKGGVDWDKHCEAGWTRIVFDLSRRGWRDSVLDMRVSCGAESK